MGRSNILGKGYRIGSCTPEKNPSLPHNKMKKTIPKIQRECEGKKYIDKHNQERFDKEAIRKETKRLKLLEKKNAK